MPQRDTIQRVQSAGIHFEPERMDGKVDVSTVSSQELCISGKAIVCNSPLKVEHIKSKTSTDDIMPAFELHDDHVLPITNVHGIIDFSSATVFGISDNTSSAQPTTDASQLTTGTLSNDRLSSDVVVKTTDGEINVQKVTTNSLSSQGLGLHSILLENDGVLPITTFQGAVDFTSATLFGLPTTTSPSQPTTDASLLTSGILADDRLSTTIPRKDEENTFVYSQHVGDSNTMTTVHGGVLEMYHTTPTIEFYNQQGAAPVSSIKYVDDTNKIVMSSTKNSPFVFSINSTTGTPAEIRINDSPLSYSHLEGMVNDSALSTDIVRMHDSNVFPFTQAVGDTSNRTEIQGGSIEITNTNIPYIDFKNELSEDHDVRLAYQSNINQMTVDAFGSSQFRFNIGSPDATERPLLMINGSQISYDDIAGTPPSSGGGGGNELITTPTLLLRKTLDQTIPDSVFTQVDFQEEVFSNGGITHEDSIITLPTPGVYLVTGEVNYMDSHTQFADNSYGSRLSYIEHSENPSQWYGHVRMAPASIGQSRWTYTATIYATTSNSTIQLKTWQTSGADLLFLSTNQTTNCDISVTRIA